MFYYVNGPVAELEPGLAVIDCGGVGYACATTNYTLSQLKKGERAKLYTYLHVREEIFELYGFSSQAELNSFKMLIGVSGVGPKAALAVLSSTSPQNLALSIVTGDEKALTAAPGIGKKIAQRIILELKDKLAKEQQEIGVPTAPGIVAGEKSKAVEAAAALGESPRGIVFRHILPNAAPAIFVCAALTVPSVMLLESFLSFLGLGVQAPLPSWGALIKDGSEYMEDAPWLLVFPAVFFSLTLFSLNRIGEAFSGSRGE